MNGKPRDKLQEEIDDILKDLFEDEDDDDLDLDMSIDSFEIKELQPLETTTCPDCKGSGIYQGIGAPEDCRNCKGAGQV